MSITAAPSLPTVEQLWERTRAMFTRALAAVGPLSQLAAIPQLSPSLRRATIRWIALLEHIVRKLLLAEAAKIPAAPALVSQPQSSHGAKNATSPAPRKSATDISRPEAWSACFSFSLPRDERAVPESRAPRIRALWDDSPPPPLAPPSPPPPPRVIDPNSGGFRLARRLEALRRVLKDPLPFAQRLAKIMRRVVRRFPEIVRRYAYGGSRSSFYDPHDSRLGLDVYHPVVPAPVCFSDSS